MAVQSLKHLHTFILRQPCWWAKEFPQAHFPYSIIENSPTSLVYNSVSVGPNNFKFGIKTYCMVKFDIKTCCMCNPYQNLEEIEYNLHNHAFGDVICKLPIV